VCLAPWPAVEQAALDVLERNAGHPGHIFNLGHGVLPQTDPAVLERLVALVQSLPLQARTDPEAGGAALAEVPSRSLDTSSP
jgi:hypothetical protein